jgi:drug/metabolite transporter (DMT)-like permease
MSGAAMTAERFAINLMIAQGALFAAETMVIHHLGTNASVMGIALIRGAAGVVLAFALAGRSGIGLLRTPQLHLQLLRGGVSLLYTWVMIYSFSHLPFADATAISFTQTAYIALFSVLILGERVTSLRWAAAALGIAGALLIAKPAFAAWNIAYLVALLGTGLNGLAFVLNRFLQRNDADATTMFYTSLIVMLGGVPALATQGLREPATMTWLPALLLLGPVGMYLGIIALRHASAATLGPYTLLRLVFGGILAIAVFREIPDLFSNLGAMLILASCFLASSAARIVSQPVERLRAWRTAGFQTPAQ